MEPDFSSALGRGHSGWEALSVSCGAARVLQLLRLPWQLTLVRSVPKVMLLVSSPELQKLRQRKASLGLPTGRGGVCVCRGRGDQTAGQAGSSPPVPMASPWTGISKLPQAPTGTRTPKTSHLLPGGAVYSDLALWGRAWHSVLTWQAGPQVLFHFTGLRDQCWQHETHRPRCQVQG